MRSCIDGEFRFQRHAPAWRLGMVAWLLCFAGCNSSSEPEETNSSASRPESLPASASQQDAAKATPKRGLSSKIKFKTATGETAFSIKPKDDGAKLVDADEKELARFNLNGSKLKVKDPGDKVLGYVVGSDGRYKITNPGQDVELWKLQQQDDGDWKLEDGQDQLIYKIKKREYGFEIEDAADNSLFKAKLKDGKTSLRDTSEKTVFSTKDRIPTIAAACLVFETIDSLPLRTALMTMLIIDAGR